MIGTYAPMMSKVEDETTVTVSDSADYSGFRDGVAA